MKIFIAGGTSGIGLALAKKYLALGYDVAICGRNKEKIKAITTVPRLKIYQLDIYNKDEFYKAVYDFSNGNLDLLISVAGIYVNSRTKPLSTEESSSMLKTNIVGTLNSFEIGRELMLNNNSGHIVAIASVAGLIDYPRASVYSRTKKTVISIADSYREALKNTNIKISTIIPGYVDTKRLRELNNGDVSKKIFLISEEEAVNLIIDAITKNKKEFIFPFKMKILIKFLNLLPKKLLTFLLNDTNYKGEKTTNDI